VLTPTTRADPTVIAQREGFLLATTTSMNESTVLTVRISPAVRRDDEWLIPLAGFLASHRHELVLREVVDDPTMMFGEAEVSIYLLEDE
jgi:hypothetical protein